MPDRPVAGAPRFAIRAITTGYAYPRNGNVHNPTPHRWFQLLLDGRVVDESPRERTLRDAAKAPGALEAYEEEIELSAPIRDELRALAKELERAERLGENDQAQVARALRRLAGAVDADVTVIYPREQPRVDSCETGATSRGL